MQDLVLVQLRKLSGEDARGLGLHLSVFVHERHLRARLLAVPELLHGL
jgi:hypothetical protein